MGSTLEGYDLLLPLVYAVAAAYFPLVGSRRRGRSGAVVGLAGSGWMLCLISACQPPGLAVWPRTESGRIENGAVTAAVVAACACLLGLIVFAFREGRGGRPRLLVVLFQLVALPTMLVWMWVGFWIPRGLPWPILGGAITGLSLAGCVGLGVTASKALAEVAGAEVQTPLQETPPPEWEGRFRRLRRALWVVLAIGACEALVGVWWVAYKLHLADGEIAHGRGDFGSAGRAYSLALQLNPLSATAQTGVGLARLSMGKCTGALTELDRAVRIAPSSSDAHRVRGQALGCLNRWPEALEECRRAQALSANAAAECGLGDALRMCGDHAQALAQYSRTYRHFYVCEAPIRDLAYALGGTKRKDDVLTLCRAALILDPEATWAREAVDREQHTSTGTAQGTAGDSHGKR
jgi:hypothetical protein